MTTRYTKTPVLQMSAAGFFSFFFSLAAANAKHVLRPFSLRVVQRAFKTTHLKTSCPPAHSPSKSSLREL